MDYLGLRIFSTLTKVQIMSVTSQWPLPKSSVRFLVPKPMVKQLQVSSLSRGLVPLAFGYYQEAYGHGIKRDKHTDNLILFCVDGTGWVEANGKRYTLSKNQIIFLPKNTPHHYNADNHRPWSIYWAHVDGHLFDEFMDIIGVDKTNLMINLTSPLAVQEEFNALIDSRYLGYQLNRFFVASNMLKKILSLISLQKPIVNITAQRHFNEHTINAYFEENIEALLTLEEMAEYFGLSKFYFAKKFQQLMFKSPVKYFLEMKVQYACKLLDSTNMNIKNIAITIGYEDQYYFSRLFKSTMGLSPTQYRDSIHGQ